MPSDPLNSPAPNPSADRPGDPAPGDSSVARPAQDETVGQRPRKVAPPADPGAAEEMPRTLGRYEVRSLLGRGSFGSVYLGYDSTLHRQVALKVPHVRVTSVAGEQEFLQEARQLARLKHPGIVTVFDAGVDGGRCYIVADYLSGLNLSKWLKQNTPTWPESVRIAAALADALAHAHAQRTVHRDLKPGNIILMQGKTPVIVDFGLALSDARPTAGQRGIVSGTPAYMSPEQARGEGHRIDGRTDIYSLGVILYRLLTGRLPFEARDVRDLLEQVLNDEPQPPRQLVPELPRELERICLKAMAKRLADRYTTAADLADDLRRLLAGPGQGPQKETIDYQPEISQAPTRPKVERPPHEPSPAPAATPEETPAEPPSSVRRAREAERRRVTIVQCGCDLFSSEEILETLDPEEQHELLLEFQQLCRGAAELFRGRVVKRTDHGVLACFGFPVAFEDAAASAVRAGLEVLERMADLNRRWQQDKGVRLAARVAVHCDQAIVQEKAEESEPISVVGPVLNVAAQLEELADPDTLLLSEDVFRLVKGFFECQEQGARHVKGIAGTKGLYRVLRERAAGSRVDLAEPTGLTPLIGRDREVGLLQERWEQAAEGMGQVVLLTGEPGIGKSRLVHRLKEHVVSQSTGEGDPIIAWRCTPHYQNSSLYPAVECFEHVLGPGGRDRPADRLDRLVRHLAALGLDGPEEVGLLASLLSVPLEGRYPPLQLSPQQLKEKTLDLLLDWLRECARRQPVLFVVEDLQWVDPTTLELLEALVEHGFSDSILVLLTFRPEFEPPWKGRAHQTQVALSRLTRRQIGEMMVLKSGLKKIPAHVVEQVAERTEGVPLFVEEFTTMVLESGRLRVADGRTEMSDTFPLHEIPATLQDLLMARLDRMASDIEVVQLAAAVGREFTYELLKAVSPLKEEALQAELAKLVEAELLFQKSRPPRTRYQFKHALIQDAAYQSLLKRKRQQFHQRIAQALEARFSEVAESQPELLAHHFTEANLAARAVPYWERAGERSLVRYAHQEAIGHLTRGLELLKTLPETPERHAREVRMHVSLGVPLQATRGYSAPEVEATYARAHALCDQPGLDAQLFPVLYGLFRYYMLGGKYREARDLGERLRGLTDQGSNLDYVVAAHRALGATLFYCGESPEALRHLGRVTAVEPTPELRAASYRYDVVDLWVTSRCYRAWALWLLGFADEARAQSARAVEEAKGLGHPFSHALGLSFASWLHQFCHDTDLTCRCAEEALAISSHQGFKFWIGWGQVIRGWTLAEAGRHDEAVAEIRQGLAAWRAQGSELGRTYFLALLAEACLAAGRTDEGLEALAEGQRFADATGERFWQPELHRLRGELLLRRGQLPEAEACYRQALEVARAQQARSLELRAVMSLGRLWHTQGRGAEACELLAPVLAGFTEGLETYDVKQARALLAGWSS